MITFSFNLFWLQLHKIIIKFLKELFWNIIKLFEYVFILTHYWQKLIYTIFFFVIFRSRTGLKPSFFFLIFNIKSQYLFIVSLLKKKFLFNQKGNSSLKKAFVTKSYLGKILYQCTKRFRDELSILYGVVCSQTPSRCITLSLHLGEICYTQEYSIQPKK